MSDGLHVLQNDCDYYEFLEVINENKKNMNVYIDHDHEPLFDWIEMEDPDAMEPEYKDEDVDSIIEDGEKCDHEEEVEVISSKRTFNDHFRKKLIISDRT